MEMFSYDKALTHLDPATGAPTFAGLAPRLYICKDCTNTIFSLQNFTGEDGNEDPMKDPIDALRYVITASPRDVETQGGEVTGGGYY
jgi:hypothetical protein